MLLIAKIKSLFFRAIQPDVSRLSKKLQCKKIALPLFFITGFILCEITITMSYALSSLHNFS